MIIRNGWHFPDMDQHFGRYKSIYPETKYQQHTLGVAYEHVKKFDNVIDSTSQLIAEVRTVNFFV